MIGTTQPRRVVAMSMAARVAPELSLTRVSYQIRYDATVSPTTTIKFMTWCITPGAPHGSFVKSIYHRC